MSPSLWLGSEYKNKGSRPLFLFSGQSQKFQGALVSMSRGPELSAGSVGSVFTLWGKTVRLQTAHGRARGAVGWRLLKTRIV